MANSNPSAAAASAGAHGPSPAGMESPAEGARKNAAPPRKASRPAVECPHCHLWENEPEDTYCGFCGKLLLPLTIRPENLVLISGMAPQKELVLTNQGSKPLQAILVPASTPMPGLTLEPANGLVIPPGGEARIKVGLDETKLPKDLMVRQLDFLCMVNNDRRKTLPVSLVVKAGPRPHPVAPAIEFGDIQEGTRTERLFELQNRGGIPLKIKEVKAEGSRQLQIAKPLQLPAVVLPGASFKIPVIWDATAAEKSPASNPTGLRLLFANYPQDLFVPAKAKLYQFNLEANPPKIHIPAALSKQTYITTVTLKNAGTVDIELSSIECDQGWITVVNDSKLPFTLLCHESLESRARAISATASESYLFNVICHPSKLKDGVNPGYVTIWTVGQKRKLTLEVKIKVIYPEPFNEYIGIDFGTTNSVIAIFDEQANTIELVEDKEQQSPLIPSVLTFVGGPDDYIIGRRASNMAPTAPELSVRSIKRIMGYDYKRKFFNKEFLPEDLASLIIRKLIAYAETQYYEMTGRYYDIKKAIITVPANFFDLQIRGILKAGADAGLDTEEDQARQAADTVQEAHGLSINAGIILDEPSAAAIYYLYHLEKTDHKSEMAQSIEREKGLNLLVFDYGGGTLDVSVANVTRLPDSGYGLKILANMGNNRIGGESLDLAVMQELLRRCKADNPPFDETLISFSFQKLDGRRRKEEWTDNVWRDVLAARNSWKDLAEKSKKDLSGKSANDLPVEQSVDVRIGPEMIVHLEKGEIRRAPTAFNSKLSTPQLSKILEGPLVECENLIKRALNLAEVVPEQIDFVLHTGRQSLSPVIRQRVKQIFPNLPDGRHVLDELNLKVCVAKGAALYGLMRKGMRGDEGAGVQLLNEGRRLPHSYGTEKIVGMLQREFDELIPRGTPYPAKFEKFYDPKVIPETGRLHLKFYQNTGTRKTIERNPEIRLLGQANTDTLADGKPGCDVQFLIDANRKLEVLVDGVPIEISPERLHDDEESWMG